MKNVRQITLAVIGGVIALSPLATLAPVSAAATATLSKQISLVDGDKITITLAGVPSTQGVYIQQCYQPAVGQRAATGLKCNGSPQQTDVMIWASMDGSRGSQSAAAPLAFTVRESVTVGGAVYPCGAGNCSLFIYRDHRGIADTSLDAIVPIMFLAQQELRMRSFGLAKDGSAVKLGSTMTLRNADMETEQGVVVRAKSTKAKICSVTRGSATTVVRFLGKGNCKLTLTAKGDSIFKQLVTTVSYTVG